MLKVIVPGLGSEDWDELKEEFVYYVESEDVELQLEHSLVALSKWESKWHERFLGRKDLTDEQMIDYIRCMTINDVDPEVYSRLTTEVLTQIKEYMDDPMTATTFKNNNDSRSNSSEATTSEIIYYWMIVNNIPVEFEHWHIKRLLTLIRVCSIKNQPAKKMSKSEVARTYRALNAERRARLGTKG